MLYIRFVKMFVFSLTGNVTFAVSCTFFSINLMTELSLCFKLLSSSGAVAASNHRRAVKSFHMIA